MRVFVTGVGVVSPAGRGMNALRTLLTNSESAIRVPDLFPIASEQLLPSGQVEGFPEKNHIPRTHRLALAAAEEAMGDSPQSPDAIVIGVTTGGILTTETHLKNGVTDPENFTFHGAGSVADMMAEKCCCKGPVITVSNACSSGTAAIKIAMEMIRCGFAQRILAGGADCLCRLTYYGFKSLQLVDPAGAHPFDKNRKGMSVGESSAMLCLEGNKRVPENAVAEIVGGGLSCDAYHPTAPDPEGFGAVGAMEAAITDAKLAVWDIDYINLHGTGTIDNDSAEAKAVRKLFKNHLPLHSSIKGAIGHSLAASGAVEAAVCAMMSIHEGKIPANIGCNQADPGLKLSPLEKPLNKKINFVLSNSFGFGGNNASIILGDCQKDRKASPRKIRPLSVNGYACLTGAGDMSSILENLSGPKCCRGLVDLDKFSRRLDLSFIRRLKRLPRMALVLASTAMENSGIEEMPSSIFFGTGWGPLSETHDFLKKLFDSGEKYPSPTDFIGSVHNAPAGQTALYCKAKGPNVTTTGGDYSFEQALLAALLLANEAPGPFLVMGADEYHPEFSPLFEPSSAMGNEPSDGGGALYLQTSEKESDCKINLSFFGNAHVDLNITESLVHKLGGHEIQKRFDLILAGIPAGFKIEGESQLERFLFISGLKCPVINYRRLTGEHASSSAVATALAVAIKKRGKISWPLVFKTDETVVEKGVLVLGLGKYVTAMEIT